MNPKKRPTIPIFNRVRLLRVERDLSRADLAAKTGVNPQTIGALERGDHSPSLDLAMRICEVFELPIEAVFSRKEFKPLSSSMYQRT
ncbi:MAG: helix-turn-helix transcriptional regulator [Corynebacterium sp.]|nr:helix-turn-helix transcriptional regulator [Corynebacterium sp.]